MRYYFYLFGAILLGGILAGCLWPGATGPGDQAREPLPTGRAIDSSLALTSTDIGSMPQNVLLSPDGRYAVTTSAGFREHICSIRVADGRVMSTIDFPNQRGRRRDGLYYGLVFGPDGTLYAAQGANATIAVFNLGADGMLSRKTDFCLSQGDFPAGLATDARGRLYVTQNDPTSFDSPFGRPGAVSIVNLSTGEELGRYVFSDSVGLSNFPLAVAAKADGSRVYVASERDDAVYVIETSEPAHPKLRATLATGAHPLALLLNKSQATLYVANAHSDTISIVDTVGERIRGTVLLRPSQARDLAGATPTGLALSDDEKTLYVSLGDMNAVAVVELAGTAGPALTGFIPAGWYPTSVAVAGKQLLVTNAKGDLSRVPHDFSRDTSVNSPLWLLEGTLWRVALPSPSHLAAMTQQSLANARLAPRYQLGENPLQTISRQAGKIQHVIYIVKENRTYDQVLGDLPQGNGDATRCLFPREVTPNSHALAERFVLLDNFYDSGEVSGDGWAWSTQAQANEYVVRNVPYQYSHRGRNFDYEGSTNSYPTGGFPASGPEGTPLSDDPRFTAGAKPINDVGAAPGGHLWDLALKQGLSYRNYGFFMTNGVTKNGQTIIPDNYPAVAALQPGGHDLAGITDLDYRRFDLAFPDSEAPSAWATSLTDSGCLWSVPSYGKASAPSRFSEWKREFDLMLAKDPSGAVVPDLITVRFGTDHTAGASPGRPTPRGMVADNDYAIGQLVEAVSHSPIWKSCAIVIIEDDAQNGPDHVDAHRSVCYVISPWIKRAAVDHSFQNTVSAIRTVESLLNLPPMCQYDAAAGVIGGWDNVPANDAPFAAILPAAPIIQERNPGMIRERPSSPEISPELPTANKSGAGVPPLDSREALAHVSQQMDFTHADRAPAEVLNRIIWKTVRGPASEMPATPHGIGTAAPPKDDDDDD